MPQSLGATERRVPRVPSDPALVSPGSSVVTLEIDNRLCAQASDKCFPDTRSAADYLAALSALERLQFPYPIKAVRGEGPTGGPWGQGARRWVGWVAPTLFWGSVRGGVCWGAAGVTNGASWW